MWENTVEGSMWENYTERMGVGVCGGVGANGDTPKREKLKAEHAGYRVP